MSPHKCQKLIDELAILYKSYPHIAIHIESNWHTLHLHKYLKNLLNKDRKLRIGFDDIIYKTIFYIYLMHTDSTGDFGDPLVITEPNVFI